MNGENIVLDAAFVLMCVSFFKANLNVANTGAIALAFVVSLIVGLAPEVAKAFPIVAPWVGAFINIVVIFLSAAGSFDFSTEMIKRANQARAPG